MNRVEYNRQKLITIHARIARLFDRLEDATTADEQQLLLGLIGEARREREDVMRSQLAKLRKS